MLGRSTNGRLGAAPGAPSPAAAPGPVGASAYAHSFASSTGTPSDSFSVSAGGLPPGLALSGAGMLAGTPTQSGTYTFTVTAQNLIGAASSQHTIQVDIDAPTAAPTGAPGANAAGWNNQDVTVNWNWSDQAGGTGIDTTSCTTSSVTGGEGAAIQVGADCADLLANTRTATQTVKVDKTPPAVTCAPAPEHSAGGTPTSPITATVSDALSGPAPAQVSVVLSARIWRPPALTRSRSPARIWPATPPPSSARTSSQCRPRSRSRRSSRSRPAASA